MRQGSGLRALAHRCSRGGRRPQEGGSARHEDQAALLVPAEEPAGVLVEEPREPVDGLVRASAARRWSFDPTITLETDIRGPKGELIHARGTRVNPLDSVPLRAELLFFDGDDPEQLAWALSQSRAAKLILTKGAPLELMKARQRRFYFDQGGKLIRHLGIGAVPARVRQQGRALEVSEIVLPPRQGARP